MRATALSRCMPLPTAATCILPMKAIPNGFPMPACVCRCSSAHKRGSRDDCRERKWSITHNTTAAGCDFRTSRKDIPTSECFAMHIRRRTKTTELALILDSGDLSSLDAKLTVPDSVASMCSLRSCCCCYYCWLVNSL